MKHSAFLLVFVLFLLVCTTPPALAVHAKAEPVAAAKTDHHNSVAELAAHGDAEAQLQMGEQTLTKAKTPAARQQALVWLMLAGMNGQVQGAEMAAKIYDQAGNAHQAARWWYRAGQLGDVNARHRFIDLFLKGKSFGAGGRDGVVWLAERALTSHDTALKLALGDVYAQGLGVSPNTSEAVRWYLDAALDDDVKAMARLGELDLNRPAIWRAPDKEPDAEGHWTGPVLAPLRPTARNDNNLPDDGRQAVAQDLHVSPEQLVFTRPGMKDGEYWLDRASRQGFAPAKTAWGLAQWDGITLPMDRVQGAWLLTSAACDFDPQALAALSRYWLDRNPVRAWMFAELAGRGGQNLPPEMWERLNKSANPRQIAKAKQIAQDWCVTN